VNFIALRDHHMRLARHARKFIRDPALRAARVAHYVRQARRDNLAALLAKPGVQL
jgi:hypothetical protein